MFRRNRRVPGGDSQRLSDGRSTVPYSTSCPGSSGTSWPAPRTLSPLSPQWFMADIGDPWDWSTAFHGHGGIQKWLVFVRENPNLEIDDDWKYPYFKKPQYTSGSFNLIYGEVYSRTCTRLGRCLLHGSAGRILPLQYVATHYLPKENLSELPRLNSMWSPQNRHSVLMVCGCLCKCEHMTFTHMTFTHMTFTHITSHYRPSLFACSGSHWIAASISSIIHSPSWTAFCGKGLDVDPVDLSIEMRKTAFGRLLCVSLF